MRCWSFALISAIALALAPASASAQYNGSSFKGDVGLKSGSQSPPGTYVGMLYVRYDGDSLRDRKGDPLGTGAGNLRVNGFLPLITWVSSGTLLGAHVGVSVAPSWAENALVAPVIQAASATGLGFGDTYVQPINLGWNFPRADVLAGFGMFIPTGRFAPGGSDNRGLGMWSYELSAGTTLFLDEARLWHASTLAGFEMHSEKKESEVRVGDVLTMEGGLGRAFLNGTLNVGAAYYAQWKVSEDQFAREALDGVISKNRVFGFGPEITLPIAANQKLIALVTARYLWETSARTTTQGNTFVTMVTFPFMRAPAQ